MGKVLKGNKYDKKPQEREKKKRKSWGGCGGK